MNQTACTQNAEGDYLRLPRVERLTGLKKTSIYMMMRQGFPAPVRIGARAVAWRESDVRAWLGARAQARQSTEASK